MIVRRSWVTSLWAGPSAQAKTWTIRCRLPQTIVISEEHFAKQPFGNEQFSKQKPLYVLKIPIISSRLKRLGTVSLGNCSTLREIMAPASDLPSILSQMIVHHKAQYLLLEAPSLGLNSEVKPTSSSKNHPQIQRSKVASTVNVVR